jgi:uroporphyrinogen III methyltransferase/synthase
VSSTVYFIGAGPGAADLITLRGLRCLQSADVVLYDRLVHPRLLRQARVDAEKIDVGVGPTHPEQEAICYLLAEKAKEGRVVARLKWGDPFVLDHGGAEALFLREQGIAFEVVPGVLPVFGAATHAGVPLTHSGIGETVVFVRTRESQERRAGTVDWSSFTTPDTTVVSSGDSAQLAEIVDSLVSHGRPADGPAALVYNPTLPSQETRVGSLGEIATFLGESPSHPAGLLIVGRVVELREHLQWFERRPLFGKRILVTRAADQALELVELLESLGADAIEAPMVRILPPDDYEAVDAACARLQHFKWIVFSSVNAVDAFMGRLLALPLDVRAMHGAKLCAVGSATSERLARYGLKVDLRPAEYRAEALGRALTETGRLEGVSVLIPRSDIGRDVVARALREHGAEVTEVVAYRTVPIDPERDGGPDVYRLLLDRRVDVVTFTSPSAVRNLVRLLGEDPARDLLRPVVVACIGPVTVEAAAQHGINATVMPAEYTVRGLVAALAGHFQGVRPVARESHG